MPMHAFEVGKWVPQFMRQPEKSIFTIDDSGATFILLMNRPTESEINYMASGQPAEFRFVVLNGLLCFLAKFGGGMWQDAPYHPAMNGSPKFQYIPDGQGIGVTCILADTSDGMVKSLRMIGMGTKFSRSLVNEVQELAHKNMELMRLQYDSIVMMTQRMYSTTNMVNLAKDYFKVR